MARSKSKRKRRRHQIRLRQKRRLKRKKLAAKLGITVQELLEIEKWWANPETELPEGLKEIAEKIKSGEIKFKPTVPPNFPPPP